MIIKTTRTEYDLSKPKEVKDLRKNISYMRSHGKKDSLSNIYNQVKPHQNYQGTDIALKNAADICHLLAPMFVPPATESKVSVAVSPAPKKAPPSPPATPSIGRSDVKEPNITIQKPPHFVVNIPAYVPSDSEGESSDEDSGKKYTFAEEEFNNPPFRIKTEARGKLEDAIPVGDVQRVPGPGKQIQQRMLDKLDTEGLIGDQHGLDKKQRLSASFGFNRPRSLSTRKNNLLQRALTSDVKTPLETKRFGFFWNYQWEKGSMGRNSELGRFKLVTQEEVHSFYKQLKNRNPKAARDFRRGQENQPRNSMVPYREIRELVKNHENTQALVRSARENLASNHRRDVYLSFIDGDTQSFHKEGDKGIYAEYTDIYMDHKKAPDVISTGYEYTSSDDHPLIQFASLLDRRVRAATAKHVPNGVYYPEPNFCIRVQEDQTTVREKFIEQKLTPTGKISKAKSALDYKSPNEATIILGEVAKRPGYQSIFGQKSPLLTTTPPRAKANKKGTPLKFKAKPVTGIFTGWIWQDVINVSRSVAQSHARGRDWARNMLHAYACVKSVTINCKDGLNATLTDGAVIRNVTISLLSRLFNSYDPVSLAEGAKGNNEKFISILTNYEQYIADNKVPTSEEERKSQEKDKEKRRVIQEFWQQVDGYNTREAINRGLAYLLPNANIDAIEHAARDSGKTIANTFKEFFDIPGLLRTPITSPAAASHFSPADIGETKKKLSFDSTDDKQETKDPLPAALMGASSANSTSKPSRPSSSITTTGSLSPTTPTDTKDPAVANQHAQSVKTLLHYDYTNQDLTNLLDVNLDRSWGRINIAPTELGQPIYYTMFHHLTHGQIILPPVTRLQESELTQSLINMYNMMAQRTGSITAQEILIPFNPGAHWILLRINLATLKITYLDSLTHENNVLLQRDAVRNIEGFGKSLSLAIKAEFTYHFETARIQSDEHACGMIVVDNILDIANQKPLPNNLIISLTDTTTRRLQHRQMLTDHGRSLEEVATVSHSSKTSITKPSAANISIGAMPNHTAIFTSTTASPATVVAPTIRSTATKGPST